MTITCSKSPQSCFQALAANNSHRQNPQKIHEEKGKGESIGRNDPTRTRAVVVETSSDSPSGNTGEDTLPTSGASTRQEATDRCESEGDATRPSAPLFSRAPFSDNTKRNTRAARPAPLASCNTQSYLNLSGTSRLHPRPQQQPKIVFGSEASRAFRHHSPATRTRRCAWRNASLENWG